MPPFREGPIKLDRKISGEMLHFLRDVGHGHRINIVDASYDIPQGSVVIDFPGSTAEAFEAIVRCIPVEGEALEQDDEPESGLEVTDMFPDYDLVPAIRDTEHHIAMVASDALTRVCERLNTFSVGGEYVDWNNMLTARRTDEDELKVTGDKGFYSIANNPDQPHTFIRTQDDLPFACVSLVVGHSQRTE